MGGAFETEFTLGVMTTWLQFSIVVALLGFLSWHISRWAAVSKPPALLQAIAVSPLLAGVGLIIYALGFAQTPLVRERFPLELLLRNAVPLIFALQPLSISVIVPRLLLRFNSPDVGDARRAGFAASCLALLVAPFGALIAGCGLAGVCV